MLPITPPRICVNKGLASPRRPRSIATRSRFHPRLMRTCVRARNRPTRTHPGPHARAREATSRRGLQPERGRAQARNRKVDRRLPRAQPRAGAGRALQPPLRLGGGPALLRRGSHPRRVPGAFRLLDARPGTRPASGATSWRGRMACRSTCCARSPGAGRHLKLRLIAAGLLEPVCARCGIDSWRGRPLSLALHHMNGDKDDNRLVNLELLCPNCHSQTENFAGRNRRRLRLVTDDEDAA